VSGSVVSTAAGQERNRSNPCRGKWIFCFQRPHTCSRAHPPIY